LVRLLFTLYHASYISQLFIKEFYDDDEKGRLTNTG